jgi:hypothetical protein
MSLRVACVAVKKQVAHHIEDNRRIGACEISSDMIMIWWIKDLGRKV